MSSRSSLFTRTAVPLLAVAATASFCLPAQAATASFDFCLPINPGNYYQGITERVRCSFTGPGTSYWTKAEFHAAGVGSSYSSTQTPWIDGDSGSGDVYYPQAGYGGIYLGPAGSGTYTCWAVCYLENSGTNYTVSTGGTDQVTL